MTIDGDAPPEFGVYKMLPATIKEYLSLNILKNTSKIIPSNCPFILCQQWN